MMLTLLQSLCGHWFGWTHADDRRWCRTCGHEQIRDEGNPDAGRDNYRDLYATETSYQDIQRIMRNLRRELDAHGE